MKTDRVNYQDISVRFSHGKQEGYGYQGYANAVELPGCASVLVSFGAYVAQPHRGHGLGSKFHQERLNWVKHKNAENGYYYGLVICTVDANNEAEKAILRKNGWIWLTSFHNICTEHNVELWGKIMEPAR